MATQLLEQYVRFQIAVAELATDLRTRLDDESGQTTVEWLVIMVGLTALAAALVASGIWNDISDAIGKAVTDIINQVTSHKK